MIGFSSDTLSGHAYLNGGGGLHVAFGWHSTLIAAMQPSLALNTVQRASFEDVVGVVWVGVAGPCVFVGVGLATTTGPLWPGLAGAGCVVGGGGFAITTGGFDAGGCCCGWVTGGGVATTTGGGCGCGSEVCAVGGGCGGGLCGPGDDCT